MTAQNIINVHDAKTHFSKLLELAHTGQEIILAKAGKPYARLMPLAPVESKRRPGRLSQFGPVEATFFEPLPDAELAAWEAQ
ncbi:MAG: type II toxin-antitoxin system prevent-host-death family antitoxin [Rhodoferax sp.]|jgi:prevent-host-death family protein|uniref:type II toxin-antitoxin system Phd/YefM family antitoxin n=1 Tax=Rhodoferax sp. TaxID=50421 RepID=UPI003BB0DC73